MGYVEGIEIDDMGPERFEIAFWVFIWTRDLELFSCLNVFILKWILTILYRLTYKVRDITLQMASSHIASTVNVHFWLVCSLQEGEKERRLFFKSGWQRLLEYFPVVLLSSLHSSMGWHMNEMQSYI